jgi:hypothetical protein
MNSPQSYEELMAMIGLGGDNAGLEAQMAQQQAQAQALRSDAPQMRQAGRVNVAPHWMEMLGGLAKNNVANQKSQQAMQTQQQIAQNKQAQYAQMLRMMQAQQPSAPPAGPGFQIPQPQSPGSLGGY